MKTKMITKVLNFVCIITSSIMFTQSMAQDQYRPQQKASVAVLNIDTRGIVQDASAMSYITRIELEKTGVYNVIDRYEVAESVKKRGLKLDSCFSKTCVVDAGKVINADKVITGSVERFNEKIIVTLRLVDIASGNIEYANTTEYLNLQPEIQRMIEVSVKKLLNIEPDPNMVNLLVNYETPVSSPKTQLRLNGPRMGLAYVMGESGQIMREGKRTGGFDMYPLVYQFGYQQEIQYLSAGDFQALFEFIGMIGGLEASHFIPSLAVMNGFRGSKTGWEFGFGPLFTIDKLAYGFYDTEELIDNEKSWHLEKDKRSIKNGYFPYQISQRMDSRGDAQLRTSMIFAAGKTFKSGYLNIPVNLYFVPRKTGSVAGVSFGFNIAKKPKIG